MITQIHIAQDSSDSIIFESLFSIFEKITDNKIILNFFRSPPTIKIEYMKRLLIYAKNKVETFEEVIFFLIKMNYIVFKIHFNV